MMRMRTIAWLSLGFGAGYLAGAAAGRPAYDRIVTSAGTVASQWGLDDAAARLKERSSDLAQTSADLAATAAQQAVDTATGVVEDKLAGAQQRMEGSVKVN